MDIEANDRIETEPAELGPFFVAALTASLAKQLANDHKKSWTDAQETSLQEKVSSLIAAATRIGQSTIRVIIVKPNGQRLVRELSIDRISKTRALQ